MEPMPDFDKMAESLRDCARVFRLAADDLSEAADIIADDAQPWDRKLVTSLELMEKLDVTDKALRHVFETYEGA